MGGVSGGKELSGRGTELTLLRCRCSDPEPFDPSPWLIFAQKGHIGWAPWAGMGNKLGNFLLCRGEKAVKKRMKKGKR